MLAKLYCQNKWGSAFYLSTSENLLANISCPSLNLLSFLSDPLPWI